MIAEFDWWLLIVGLGTGAAVTWLVLVDLGRRDEDLTQRERAEETDWIETGLAQRGRPTSPETIRAVLDLHTAYVARPVPTDLEAEPEPAAAAALPQRPAPPSYGTHPAPVAGDGARSDPARPDSPRPDPARPGA